MSDVLDKIKQLQNLAVTLDQLAQIGAQAYANGYNGHPAIVIQHYTPGNQQRQSWEPLAPAYAAWKAAGLQRFKRGKRAGEAKGLQALKSGQRARLDLGAKAGGGAASGNLPMLVLTGALRAAVSSGKHRITVSNGVAVIVFAGLPDYAEYLQEGGKAPKRSPVDIAPDDRRQILDVMRKEVRVKLSGQGGQVPQSVQPGSTPRIV